MYVLCYFFNHSKRTAVEAMRNLTGSSCVASCSVRWAFNFQAWNPTEQEWMLATQCIQQEEKKSIEKFAFKKDAKASMAGQLLIRKFIHSASNIPFNEIKTQRDNRNKPYFPDSNIAFNVSHQGAFSVLAGEIGAGRVVGVDIMHFERRTGDKLNEFFRLMSRTFTTEEWETINSFSLDKDRINMFYRHWCLKESYVKAIGVGITLDLKRIRFKINTRKLSQTEVCLDTELFVDGVRQSEWQFEEWLLDQEHCVAVALSGHYNSNPPPFLILDWAELTKGVTPILPPDPEAAHRFFVKPERPQ